jgi:hypothetical protein
MFDRILGAILPFMNPRDVIPPSTKLACLLNILGHPKTEHEAGEKFGIGEATVAVLIPTFARAIVAAFSDEITFPLPGSEGWISLKDGFRRLCGFRDAVGAIDSSHIYLSSKPGLLDFPEHYSNRKDRYSVHLQAVVSADKKFLNISAGQPGRMHDSNVLQRSRLFLQVADWCDEASYLLGDNGYPCLNWIMVPVKGSSTVAQTRFNESLRQGRIVVENAFGILKNRFPILRSFRLDLQRAPLIIKLCCILHNLCADDMDEYVASEPEEDGQDLPAVGIRMADTRSGVVRRAELMGEQ